VRFKDRPSYSEISTKLYEAKMAIAENKHCFGPQLDKLVDEFIQLHIGDVSEIWSLVQVLLQEISPEDYAGPHPPMRCTESNASNQELLIFIWDSKKMRKRMYIKFAVHNQTFYYVSLHASQEKKKQWKLVPNFSSPPRKQCG